jgi:hypothetical protein
MILNTKNFKWREFVPKASHCIWVYFESNNSFGTLNWLCGCAGGADGGGNDNIALDDVSWSMELW